MQPATVLGCVTFCFRFIPNNADAKTSFISWKKKKEINASWAFSSSHAFRKTVNIRLGNRYCQAQKETRLQILIVFHNFTPLTSHVTVISSWNLHPSEPGNKFWLQSALSRYPYNVNTSETQFKSPLRKRTKELAEMFKKSRCHTWDSMDGGVKVITGNNLDKTNDYRRYNRTSGTITRKTLIEWGRRGGSMSQMNQDEVQGMRSDKWNGKEIFCTENDCTLTLWCRI